MDKNIIKFLNNSFILNIEKNSINEDKNNFWYFSQYKKSLIQKRKYFNNNISKFLLLIKMLLLIDIKFTQSINKKRKIFSQFSLIKIKIESSGNQTIYSNGNYEFCQPIVIPDEIIINEKNQSEIKNEYFFENSDNEITLIWHNPLEYTSCMFRDCNSITEIDLSNFDDSQLIRMHYMFYDCHSLKEIEISNIKGNKVTDAGFLFGNCYQLKSINLANFYPSKNAYVHYMFKDCNSLISLNFPNFNSENSEKIENIVSNCNNLQYINLENAVINNEIKLALNSIINTNHILCTHSPKLISIIKNKSAILNCTNNYCLNQIEDDDCFSLNYRYKHKNIFYENCPNGTYNDSFECIDCNEKCSLCSKESNEKDLCLSCNISNNYYEKYNNSFNSNPSFKDCFKSLKGFYLDSSDLLYKQCYYSCDSCDNNGNKENHNCIECNQDNKYELKLNNYYNCYGKCPNFYFIEENNEDTKYKCTLNSECPDKYNKLIEDLGKCIDKCEKENNYKYEYRNKCFKDCPEGTIRNKNTLESDKIYFCKPICEEEKPFEIIKEQNCVKFCSIEELNSNICIFNFNSNNQENSNEDILIKILERYFISEDYNRTKMC